MIVLILMGVSGAGKSTYAKQLGSGIKVVSADYYFEKDGEYKFDPIRLPDAHSFCLAEYVRTLQDIEAVSKTKYLVVDNTNTTLIEIAPYIALAKVYGRPVEVMLLTPPSLEVAAERNLHAVPLDQIKLQEKRLQQTLAQWPPYWGVSVK